MPNIVEYILQLQSSQFEGGIAKAEASTNALDHSFNSLKSTVVSALAVLGSAEFLKSSVDSFNSAAQASAQLDASLRSTGNQANLNRQALDDMASALMKVSLYDDDEITSSEALLATFTNIHDSIYMQAIPAIVDMSTKMGGDLKETTLQVGKALQDPVKGVMALHRVGVNFSEAQVKVLKSLVDTNRMAEAQTMILQELQTEFGGSALAASEAGTGGFTVLQNEFGNVKEEIGALVVAFMKDLKPQIEWLIGALGKAVRWVSEHKEGIKELAIGFVAYKAAMVTLVPLVEGFALASTAAAAATTEVAVASTAALGPLGLLAAAVGAIAMAWYGVANAKEAAQEADNALMATHTKNTNQYLDEQLKKLVDSGMKEEEARKKIADQYTSIDNKQYEQLAAKLKQASALQAMFEEKGMSGAAKKAKEDADSIMFQMKEVQADLNSYSAFRKKPAPTSALGKASTTSTSPITTPKISSPTGAKAVTINVQIKEFGKTTINATTIKEASTKLHDHITTALMGAINDFQVIAAH